MKKEHKNIIHMRKILSITAFMQYDLNLCQTVSPCVINTNIFTLLLFEKSYSILKFAKDIHFDCVYMLIKTAVYFTFIHAELLINLKQFYVSF